MEEQEEEDLGVLITKAVLEGIDLLWDVSEECSCCVIFGDYTFSVDNIMDSFIAAEIGVDDTDYDNLLEKLRVRIVEDHNRLLLSAKAEELTQ